jgi:lysophospholipase L1-like esterase
MPREYMMKAGVTAASFLLTLVALELGLRLFGYNPLGDDWKGSGEYVLRVSTNPDLQYELTPGAAGRFSVDVKINSQGFRGPEPSSSLSARRVIVLGDSIAFGSFMPWEDTFSSQLQNRMDATNRDVEILNFGVGGYDVLQEVSLLKSRGLNYHPKLVVVAYCLNDISIASASVEEIERRRSLKSPIYWLRLAQFVWTNIETIRLKRWLSHMNEPEVFRRTYENQIDSIGEDEVELLDLMKNAPKYPSTTYYGDRDRVGRLRFSFRQLANSSKENHFQVVIMIIPLLIGDGGTYSHRVAHRIVERESRRAGFDVIDLTDAFMAVGTGNLTSSLGDIIHPNKRGHTIMAGVLSEYIVNHLK